MGTYIGVSATDYNRLSASLPVSRARGPSVYSASGALSLSVAAGQLAYCFNLRGPAVAVDTGAQRVLFYVLFYVLLYVLDG
jgi:acyl transferase domain-containing protein